MMSPSCPTLLLALLLASSAPSSSLAQDAPSQFGTKEILQTADVSNPLAPGRGGEGDGGQEPTNARCVCTCPDSTVVTQPEAPDRGTHHDFRSIYVNATVTPDDCKCSKVVLVAPELRNLTQAQAASFCPRCKCEFQERNLVIIKVVVILVIWAVSVLVIYMGFLSCLEPVLSGRRGNGQQAASSSSTSRYREHRDSDEEEMDDDDEAYLEGSSRGSRHSGGGGGRSRQASNSTPMSSFTNSLGTQQSRWKRQVQEQRRNIYDRHAMLN